MNRIGFGGGCHWCTEAVFQQVTGVVKVEQGWIGALVPNDAWSEAVIVHFEPEKIHLRKLILIHLKTHSCTSDHSMRTKYRSAVYVFEEGEISVGEKIIGDLQGEFDGRIVTEVLLFDRFKENKEEYRNYYLKNPEKEFCRRYIEPKLEVVRTVERE